MSVCTVVEEGNTNSHGEQTRSIMLEGKVLVLKGLEAPDTRRTSAISVEKVTALTHEVGDLFPQYQPACPMRSNKDRGVNT